MIKKHSDWELGAYLYEYNGAPIPSVSFTNPITLLSETFFTNFTKSFINKKFFYFDLSKDTYFLKCNVECILKFFIPLTTENNNSIYTLIGYYANPLQLKTKALPDIFQTTTANTPVNYKTGNNDTNSPKWVATKDNTFFIGSVGADTITLSNNAIGFVWSLLLRQI